ncbi:5-dehydro-4-deoxy-D-glucuronate isomerase [Vibrio sp. DW001]|uniref:5-dehydro-4-deoxy-D-glucuronate isomerase n=1 Tax=Vibrio sp. DW001 TaxID=2912315 RepID=UPI0023B17B72|nr:5-dehydro-4-deoxy-D-glucuronate isomerase [Vibrio sp. DW001]WED26833.1 5-dehydro-4-deoxy-D-glucuronate isomerase [Vibrio sp. DW001]
MITKYSNSPEDVKHYQTSRLRKEFLIESLFNDDFINIVYSHIDRVVAIGVSPLTKSLKLEDFIEPKSFGVEFFLQRREMGIANIGGAGEVTVNGERYHLDHLDVLYIGLGNIDISFASNDSNAPAQFYCLSSPAHQNYPTVLITKNMAKQLDLGEPETVNARTLNQYIHPDVMQSCQLSMGITHIKTGSAWNTMPCHTHERRMEAYFYFNIEPNEVVFHFMGEPTETRHLVIKNKELVFSPSWSIHSGCGTKNYSFIWGMAGENQTFDDMDFIANSDLK